MINYHKSKDLDISLTLKLQLRVMNRINKKYRKKEVCNLKLVNIMVIKVVFQLLLTIQ